MRLFKNILLASLAVVVAAAPKDEPTATPAPSSNSSSSADPGSTGTCAMKCASQALPAAGCKSFSDFACFCTKQSFVDASIKCVAKACPDTYDTAVQAVKAVCTSNGQDMTKVTFPQTLPGTATSSPKSPTSTANSTTPAPATPGSTTTTPPSSPANKPAGSAVGQQPQGPAVPASSHGGAVAGVGVEGVGLSVAIMVLAAVVPLAITLV
ncbi:hypothetical protein V8E36_004748 [Tilletia maclaganii]